MARVVIVGGGPGGYESALVAAQLGAEVVVVDSDGVGGSAVLTDCVPSKTLIATAEVMTDFGAAGELGIVVDEPRVDLARINERVKALALAQSAYDRLNPHPYRTFTDPIDLKTPLAELTVGKSYLNCQQDIALPHSMPWHPRLSEKLGLFRLVECQGSHEIWFTDPATLAQALIRAGRD